MAVIISNGATDLHAASGFYRVEASNLGIYNNTTLALSTTRSIAVTFANAGNCQGVVIGISTSSATQDVTVTLKESGTARASKTLTNAQIINSTSYVGGHWLVPFTFTAPYAVTTTGGVWTIEVSQSTASAGWGLMTSNGTAPFYAAWCDNAMTFANNDTVICKDIVTISQTCTVKGTLGTGDAVNATAIWVCKSDSAPTKTNNASKLQIIPAATMTLSINGLIGWGSHSGIQAGTSTVPVPVSKLLTIDFILLTVGSAYGFKGLSAFSALRGTFLFYGEYPTTERYTLTAQANVGASSFSVADTTGISNGDIFHISKASNAQYNTITFYTVTGTTATTVSITPTITGYARLAGGVAYKASGYGIKIIRSGATGSFNNLFGVPSNWYVCGMEIFRHANDGGFAFGASSLAQSGEDSSYRSKWQMEHCIKGIVGGSAYQPLTGGYTPYEGISMNDCAGFGSMMIISSVQQYDSWTVGAIEEKNNYSFSQFSGGKSVGTNGYATWDIQDNIFEMFAYGSLKGKDSIVKNNYFRGGSGGGWQFYLQDFLNCAEWSGNTWDETPTSLNFQSAVLNLNMKDELNVGTVGSTSHIYARAGCNMINVIMENPSFTPTINITEQLLWVDGSKLSIVDTANVSGSDVSYIRTGVIHRTKSGLSDTTVRTSGGSAMRFTPNSSTQLAKWEQTIPTGDITSKTMTITCWVYINNSAYYAGTHTNPTLTVTYDKTSTVTSVATATAGSWQQLACTFTPTTAYGQVTMKITGATDATTTSRYFYVDDFNIAYPAGVQVDLGGLDLWANGLPVEPAIATMPSITGVWDEPLSAHTIAGSAGKILKDGADNAEAAAYDMYK